jgi:hypothetical protein
MHQIMKDPEGKLFKGQSFVNNDKLDRFCLLDVETGMKGQTKKISEHFTAENVREKAVQVFVCYQLGFYATAFANEWKREILSRWPKMSDRIVGVELRENKWSYAFLRWMTQRKVNQDWKEGLDEKNKELVVWQGL